MLPYDTRIPKIRIATRQADQLLNHRYTYIVIPIKRVTLLVTALLSTPSFLTPSCASHQGTKASEERDPRAHYSLLNTQYYITAWAHAAQPHPVFKNSIQISNNRCNHNVNCQ